jgi:hypothetical protein
LNNLQQTEDKREKDTGFAFSQRMLFNIARVTYKIDSSKYDAIKF